jgi:hypothetical protein
VCCEALKKVLRGFQRWTAKLFGFGATYNIRGCLTVEDVYSPILYHVIEDTGLPRLLQVVSMDTIVWGEGSEFQLYFVYIRDPDIFVLAYR